jgi:hypothetical protein
MLLSRAECDRGLVRRLRTWSSAPCVYWRVPHSLSVSEVILMSSLRKEPRRGEGRLMGLGSTKEKHDSAIHACQVHRDATRGWQCSLCASVPLRPPMHASRAGADAPSKRASAAKRRASENRENGGDQWGGRESCVPWGCQLPTPVLPFQLHPLIDCQRAAASCCLENSPAW